MHITELLASIKGNITAYAWRMSCTCRSPASERDIAQPPIPLMSRPVLVPHCDYQDSYAQRRLKGHVITSSVGKLGMMSRRDGKIQDKLDSGGGPRLWASFRFDVGGNGASSKLEASLLNDDNSLKLFFLICFVPLRRYCASIRLHSGTTKRSCFTIRISECVNAPQFTRKAQAQFSQ